MAERVPGSPEPPGAQDSAPNTIQLINVLVMREGETVSAKWGIHPQLKKDLIPAEWEELSEHMNRSEEHTSELQSQSNLVCRLLLEKKKKNKREDSKYEKRLHLYQVGEFKQRTGGVVASSSRSVP